MCINSVFELLYVIENLRNIKKKIMIFIVISDIKFEKN